MNQPSWPAAKTRSTTIRSSIQISTFMATPSVVVAGAHHQSDDERYTNRIVSCLSRSALKKLGWHKLPGFPGLRSHGLLGLTLPNAAWRERTSQRPSGTGLDQPRSLIGFPSVKVTSTEQEPDPTNSAAGRVSGLGDCQPFLVWRCHNHAPILTMPSLESNCPPRQSP